MNLAFPCEHGSPFPHALNPDAIGDATKNPIVCVGRPINLTELIAEWNARRPSVNKVQFQPLVDALAEFLGEGT